MACETAGVGRRNSSLPETRRFKSESGAATASARRDRSTPNASRSRSRPASFTGF